MQEAEHHGDRWFKATTQQASNAETIKNLRVAIEKTAGVRLGETGRFTEGALTPDDEGELRFAVTSQGGKVILAFGKQIEWIGMPPATARALADALNKYAGEV